jgi:hypothetical protein
MLQRLLTYLRAIVAQKQALLAEEEYYGSLLSIRARIYFSWKERLVRIDASKLHPDDDYMTDEEGNCYLFGEHPLFLYQQHNKH